MVGIFSFLTNFDDYFGERAPPISEQSEPLLLGMDLML
jgi:hypothetical protein